jgi:predicted ABC-type exoprotein transport system permease subunit
VGPRRAGLGRFGKREDSKNFQITPECVKTQISMQVGLGIFLVPQIKKIILLTLFSQPPLHPCLHHVGQQHTRDPVRRLKVFIYFTDITHTYTKIKQRKRYAFFEGVEDPAADATDAPQP